jgi:UDP-glucose 4-epimerase
MSNPGTIAVTGGGGFIARALARQLLLLFPKSRIKLLDIKFSPTPAELKAKQVEQISCDIRDESALLETFADVDVVFHKAGLLGRPPISMDSAYIEKFLETNTLGTYRILDACNKSGVRKIIFDSTKEVFGAAAESFPALETTTAHPRNFYGLSKHLAERYITMFCRESDIKAIILRYSRVRSHESRDVIYRFCEAVHSGRPITIKGGADKEMDFVDIADAINGNILALKKNIKHGIFHISSGESITLGEIAKKISSLFGKQNHPIVVENPSGQIDFEPKRNRLDITEAKSILGFNPSIGIIKMIEDTFNYFKSTRGQT